MLTFEIQSRSIRNDSKNLIEVDAGGELNAFFQHDRKRPKTGQTTSNHTNQTSLEVSGQLYSIQVGIRNQQGIDRGAYLPSLVQPCPFWIVN